MARDRLATAAIIVCMVAAVSTLPALLIAGSLPQPVVNNYYQTTNTTTNTTTPITNTNVTYYINGTWQVRTCHFANITATIPYSTGTSNVSIYNILLINRTLVTSMVAFMFNRYAPPGGGSYYIYSTLNGQSVTFPSSGSSFPILNGDTVTGNPYYTIWNNPYQADVYPNASTYVLGIRGYQNDPIFPAGVNVSVGIWWETW